MSQNLESEINQDYIAEDVIDDERVEINVTDDGGIKKKILTLGTGLEKPEKGDKVEVHYVGTLLDGTKFDSSRDRSSPFEFTLGVGSVIKGWDLGVATMTKGEVAILTCTAEYAYGKNGSPPKIPGDATLQFEVELLKWKSDKDIEGDGNLIKTIVDQGTGYLRPKPKDEVKVRYKAFITGNNECFAETGEDGVEFTLEDGHLSAGLEVALKTMKKGERASIKLGPKYGCKGCFAREDVPQDASITVDLELVSWKSVTDVTDDGKVLMKTLTGESTEYKTPIEGSLVTVRMTGSLEDGKKFVEFAEGGEYKFALDEEVEVEGIELAIKKMKKNEKAEIKIAPEYGFGAEEAQQPLATVPANSVLKYVIELVDFSNPQEAWQIKGHEKVCNSRELKDQGNVLFKAGKLRSALKRYRRAEKLVHSDTGIDEADKVEAKALKATCLLNEAAVLLKMKDWKEARAACSKVLEQESHNVKALYRRAEAYLGSEDFFEGIADLKRALEIEPSNRDVASSLKRAKQMQSAVDKKQAKLYGNMFTRLAKMEEKENMQKGHVGEAAEKEAAALDDGKDFKIGDLEEGITDISNDSVPLAPLNE